MTTDKTRCVRVAIVDDDIALEEDERFRIDINAPNEIPGLQLGLTAVTYVTIIDNDGNTTHSYVWGMRGVDVMNIHELLPPATVVVVSLGASSYEVVEGASRVSVCLTKDKITAQGIPIILTVQESIPPSAIGTYDISTHTSVNTEYSIFLSISSK